MLISEIEIYEVLREKMDEREAKALVMYIENRVENKFEQAQSIFATKEDITKLELKISLQIAELKAETLKLIADSRAETSKQIAEYKAETSKQIAESKAEMIKWMFGFVFVSTLTVIGVILSVMKMGGW